MKVTVTRIIQSAYRIPTWVKVGIIGYWMAAWTVSDAYYEPYLLVGLGG